jgi:endoglucanase
VNGVAQPSANLPSTGSWNAYQLSSAANITLPAGQSTISIVAQANFVAFNLQGLLVTPGAPAQPTPTPSVTPAQTAAPTATPTPTPTPVPTATPTPTPRATPTPSPTPIATATPAPTATPTGPITTVSSTATTGFNIVQDAAASGYTLYTGSPSIWGNLQANGYIQYNVSVSVAGSYALSLYYSSAMSGGGANVSVNGGAAVVASIPNTGSWNTYQMNPATNITLPIGYSVIKIAASSSNFQAFNLGGMTLAPTSLAPAPTATPVQSGSYPLANAQFYINAYSASAIYASANPGDSCLQYYPSQPNLLNKIVQTAQGVWFGSWNSDPQTDAANVMTSAGSSVPIVIVYNIPDRDCGGYSAGGSNNVAGYEAWVLALSKGIGAHKAAVVLEPDALSQLSVCLSSSQQSDRLSMLSYAVSVLKTNAPNAAVYLDAGHEGAIDVQTMANSLQAANVANAAGFALNTSNYLPTAANTTYGNQISALIGNKHFVIDTSRNSQGGDLSQWCNVANQGIGAKPVGFSSGLIDAYLWVQNPGTSDGSCNGAPAAGSFWLQGACELASKSSW